FVDLQGDFENDHQLRGVPVVSARHGLDSIVERFGVTRIVVALEDRRNVLPTRDLVRLRVQGIRIEEAHSTIAALTGRVWLETVRPSWFVFSDGFRRSTLTLIAKRAIDLAFGIAGLILTAPIMAVVAIIIKLDSPGPVFYCQTRVGLKGKCFRVIKF